MKAAILVRLPLVFYDPLPAQPKAEVGVLAAVTRIYSAASAGDSAAFLAVVPSGGYTEFPENGGPLIHLDTARVRDLLGALAKGELKVDLRRQSSR